jgi:hypothetical protein
MCRRTLDDGLLQPPRNIGRYIDTTRDLHGHILDNDVLTDLRRNFLAGFDGRRARRE